MQQDGRKDSICVLDDDEPLLDIMREALACEGYNVAAFSEAQPAVDYCKKGSCDILIADIFMPDANGLDVVRELKAAQPELGVIVITALPEMRMAQEALRVGADDFLAKPFSLEHFLASISRALERRRLRRENRQYQWKLEEKLRELEQLRESKRELIAMFVHDLKNPLSIIMGRLELLAVRGQKLSAKDKRQVERATTAADQMLDLISRILDISKLEAGSLNISLTPIDPADFIARQCEKWEAAAQAKNITLHCQENGSVPDVLADRSLLDRTAGNLIRNALEHARHAKNIYLSARKAGASVRFAVRDDGDGMTRKGAEKLFDGEVWVSRRSASSRGIGLTFCLSATRSQGGKIWCESKHVSESKQSGCTFVVEFPVAQEREDLKNPGERLKRDSETEVAAEQARPKGMHATAAT